MRDDLTAASDTALVVALARYHHEALAEVYRRHAGSVFGLAKRLLNDQAKAEEVVQEVFVRLWNQPDRFDPREAACAASCWPRRTAGRSTCCGPTRRDGVVEERDARRAADGGYDVDREVWDMALAEQVRSAMNALHADERAAVELAYFGGRTYREVADELGEAEGTVKSRIRSGLRRLRAEMVASGVTVGDL